MAKTWARKQKAKDKGLEVRFESDDGWRFVIERTLPFRGTGGSAEWRPSFLSLWFHGPQRIEGWVTLLHDTILLHHTGVPIASKTLKVNPSTFAEAEALLYDQTAAVEEFLSLFADVYEYEPARKAQG